MLMAKLPVGNEPATARWQGGEYEKKSTKPQRSHDGPQIRGAIVAEHFDRAGSSIGPVEERSPIARSTRASTEFLDSGAHLREIIAEKVDASRRQSDEALTASRPRFDLIGNRTS